MAEGGDWDSNLWADEDLMFPLMETEALDGSLGLRADKPPEGHEFSDIEIEPVLDANKARQLEYRRSEEVRNSASYAMTAQPTVSASRAVNAQEKRQQNLPTSEAVPVLYNAEYVSPGMASSLAEVFSILANNLTVGDVDKLIVARFCNPSLECLKYLKNIKKENRCRIRVSTDAEYVSKVCKHLQKHFEKKREQIQVLFKELKPWLTDIQRSEIIINLQYNNSLITCEEAYDIVRQHSLRSYMTSKATEAIADPPKQLNYIFLHLMLALLGARPSVCKGAAVFTRYFTDMQKGIGFDFDSSLKDKFSSLGYLFVPIMIELAEGFHYTLVVCSLNHDSEPHCQLSFLDSSRRCAGRKAECLKFAAIILNRLSPGFCTEKPRTRTMQIMRQTNENSTCNCCGVFIYHFVKSLLEGNYVAMKEFNVLDVRRSIDSTVTHHCRNYEFAENLQESGDI